MSVYSDLVLGDNPVGYWRLGDYYGNPNGGSLGNPGFESQQNGTAVGWIAVNVGTGTVITNDTTAHTGLFNAKLTNPSTGNYAGIFGGSGVQTETPSGNSSVAGTITGLPTNDNRAVVISGWFKAGGGNGSTGPFRCTFSNIASYTNQPSANGGTVTTDNTVVYTAFPNYQYFTFTVRVPRGYQYLYIEIYSAGNGACTPVFIDDVSVTWVPYDPDPSFELGSLTAEQTQWALATPGEFTYDTTPGNYLSGSGCLKVTTTRTATGWNSGELITGLTVGPGNNLFAVSPGQQYYMSIWLKQQEGARASHYKVTWFDSGGNGLGNFQAPSGQDGDLPWTQFHDVWTVPNGAVYASVDVMWGYWGGNLLTANEASVETSITGWSAEGSATVSQSPDIALDGSYSIKLQSTASNSGMNAVTASGTSGKAVSASTQYTAVASVRAASTTQNFTLFIRWYKSSGAASTVNPFSAGTTVPDTTSGWTKLIVTATSPSDAAFAQVVVGCAAANGSGEKHYIDCISLAAGPNTDWRGSHAQIWFDDAQFYPMSIAYNSVNAPNGLISGFVTLQQTGGINDGSKAMAFDGSTGLVSIPGSVWDPSGNKPYSIEAWVKPAVVDASFRRLAGREPAGNHGAMLAWHNSLKFYTGRGDASAGIETAAGGSPTVGVWAHLVGTYDGTTLRMYVNGALVQAVASSRSVDVQSTPLLVGGTVGGGTNGQCTAGELAVYNYALSATQIANHYNAGITAWTAPTNGTRLDAGKLVTIPDHMDMALADTKPFAVNVAGYLKSTDGISNITATLINISTGQTVTGWQGTITVASNVITIPIIGSALILKQRYQLAVTFTANFQKTLTLFSFINVVA
jgi:Concanavalin A-like lectin/glucanases superfamily